MNKYEKFMLESNKIEGEDRVNPGDLKAVEFVLDHGLNDVHDFLIVHKMLGEYLHKPWVGKFRTVNVQVGDQLCPQHKLVPELMNNFVLDLNVLDSWDAHNRFEKIHPFRDLNGRTGRLLWLSKAVEEGYSFSIPFLQMYYYQTLRRIGNKC